MKEGLNMLKDLDVAKVLIEAFDNDETGILLYDKKDKLCFANKPMFTRFNRLNVNYEIGESVYDRMEKFKKLKILPEDEINQICEEAKNLNCKIITTEKDFFRLNKNIINLESLLISPSISLIPKAVNFCSLNSKIELTCTIERP